MIRHTLAVASLALALAACNRDGMSRGGQDGTPTAPTVSEAPSQGPSSSPAPASHAGYVAALAALERGETKRARGDLAEARDESDAAIRSLGNEYSPRDVEDDTSLKLAAADELWKEGKREDALHTKVRMLRSRLDLYLRKNPDAPAEPRKLALVLSVTNASPRAGDPVEIVASLKSTGTAPVVVNSRLALNSSHAPDSMREIVLDIKGPDGKLLPFTARVKIGSPDTKDAKTLQPGESIAAKIALDSYFAVGSPGEYRITGRYETSPLLDANGTPAWTVLVYSDEMSFSRSNAASKPGAH